MALFRSPEDAEAARAIAELCYTNPFTAERIELERAALGPAFDRAQAVWSRTSLRFTNPNVPSLRERTRQLLHTAHTALERGKRPNAREDGVYEGLVRYHLFDASDGVRALVDGIVGALERGEVPQMPRRIAAYRAFAAEAERCFGVGGRFPEELTGVPHLFAISVQALLSFTLIFQSLLGTSRAATALRASTWRSIFTRDMRGYERGMFERMFEMPTLVLGPSGSGKELVARAIGLCGYVPFDARRESFVAPLAADFRALNLAALSRTLIESELFGHKQGAFTGALEERVGFFERCGPHGSVFLDEIGELEPEIQVKLLRLLQSRRFEPVGGHETRQFRGRVISATHRDLFEARRSGAFRSDLYYRLCAHRITTPSLASQLAEAPDDLRAFVEHIVERVLGGPERAARHDVAALCERVIAAIAKLGPDYPWPGNVRELEQCVRSLFMEPEYEPERAREVPARPPPDLRATLGRLRITGNALLDEYCAALYEQCGSIGDVASTMGLTRGTVRARLRAAGGLPDAEG